MLVNSEISVQSGGFETAEREKPYLTNVDTILQLIEYQFIRAVQDANNLSNNHKLFFSIYRKSKKFGVPLGQEFKEMPVFSVWISQGREMDYNLPHRKQGEYFDLGELLLDVEPENLKKMALTGNISEFQDVYTHCFDELNRELQFFQENLPKIKQTKDKINQVVRQVVRGTFEHFQSKKYSGSLIVAQSSFPSDNINYESQSYQPLNTINFWVKEADKPLFRFIGDVTIVESRERFKQIVNGNNVRDINEISTRCLAEMINRLDASQAPITYYLSRTIKQFLSYIVT